MPENTVINTGCMLVTCVTQYQPQKKSRYDHIEEATYAYEDRTYQFKMIVMRFLQSGSNLAVSVLNFSCDDPDGHVRNELQDTSSNEEAEVCPQKRLVRQMLPNTLYDRSNATNSENQHQIR